MTYALRYLLVLLAPLAIVQAQAATDSIYSPSVRALRAEVTAGDSAAFIDPFTGSGMLMALEGGELAAHAILKHLPDLRAAQVYESMGRDYREQYHRRFGSRLRVCAMLRRAAFVPSLADLVIGFFGLSERLRHSFAQATRAKASVSIFFIAYPFRGSIWAERDDGRGTQPAHW